MSTILKIQGALKIQGQLLTTYATLDMANWVNRLLNYNLTLPSSNVLHAVDVFLYGLTTSGLRSKINRLNLFSGGDYISSFFPQITDIGSTWDWNGKFGSTVNSLSSGPFTSSMWSLTNGFDGYTVNNPLGQSSAGAYLDTGISTNNSSIFYSNLQNYSIHFAAYVNTQGSKTGKTEMGLTVSATTDLIQLRANYTTSNQPAFNTYTGSNPAGTNTNALVYSKTTPFDPRGFIVGTRTSNASTTFYRNNVKPIPANTNYFNPNTNQVAYDSSLKQNGTVIIFSDGSGNNVQGSTRTMTNYTDRAISMYSIGSGLSDTDVATFTSLINTFNTNIGRTNYA